MRSGGAPGGERPRRIYLDWMRGLAVLVMIEAHLIDSWTRPQDRGTGEYAWAMILGGMGAPLFLFLAGLSVPLSAASKARRSNDPRAAAMAVTRRGAEIFGLAFLFRLQAWALGWGSWRGLLKVDILNIMGPAIAACAALWGAARTTRARYVVFALAAVLTSIVTPVIRTADWLAALPDPLEAYIRPVQPLSTFVMFPWAGLVFAGAVLGVAIEKARTREDEARLNAWFVGAGASLAIVAHVSSFLPSPYERSDFWTSSPAFFFLRVGLMTALVGIAYAWNARDGWRGSTAYAARAATWSPLAQLGRTSLFIYWIHVEMIYGLISLPLHKALSFGNAWLAFALFSLLMLFCSIAKDRVVAWWTARRSSSASHVAPAG